MVSTVQRRVGAQVGPDETPSRTGLLPVPAFVEEHVAREKVRLYP